MSGAIHTAILGARGYGAGELLRLLAQHPSAAVISVVSSACAGERVDRVHPHLRGFYETVIAENVDFERFLDADNAVVFSAQPHGVSGRAVDELLNEIERRGAGERVRVVDLSGDLRLRDAELHTRFYPDSATLGERRASAAYGLAELNREAIRTALLVANPGCLASAAILACAPLVRLGLTGMLVVDAKTGSSGSGRTLKEATHHPARHANVRAYKPLAHQHEPEILQALGDPHGETIRLSFVPQSLDLVRGIFVTVHALLDSDREPGALRECFQSFYADAPFVRIVAGSPELQDVVGSNFCDIAIAQRGRQVIVMAALDNLVKGMAGAAIQNMNLMCGLDERTGLWAPALRPM